jgi:hypothetical protein
MASEPVDSHKRAATKSGVTAPRARRKDAAADPTSVIEVEGLSEVHFHTPASPLKRLPPASRQNPKIERLVPLPRGDTTDKLRRNTAARKLSSIRETRLIAQMAEEGHTQVEIARLADVSQAHVSRTLAAVKAWPEMTAVTPNEIVWSRNAGEITNAIMMQRLLKYPFTFGQMHDDEWERGSWDDLELLHTAGDLSRDEYRKLTEQIGGQGD